MKIYLLTQNQNTGYDTYDSIIVMAESEEDAKTIGPNNDVFPPVKKDFYSAWADTIDGITCEEIGIAKEGETRGVVLASFNAG